MPCSNCDSQACFTGTGEMPAGCPDKSMKNQNLTESDERFLAYALKNREKQTDRVSELISYARFNGCQKIGIAGCIGLHDELRVITSRLKDEGFEVNTVMCKAGHLEKKAIGVPAGNRMTTETGYGIGVIACNPVAQALLLNHHKTEINCIMGLCVGHDTVFMKHSQAPVVTLVAKDRTNAHNPASILYGFYGDNFFDRRPSPEGASEFNKKHVTPVDIFRSVKKKIRSRS